MAFDPYQEWLSIPPDRRPLTPCALLGLPEGETDPRRVHQSAAERYEHVRKYVLGPHGDVAQRILTEISRAAIDLQQGPAAPAAPPSPSPPAASGNHRESVAVLTAQPVGVEYEKGWPTSYRDWLADDRLPDDVYHLLGRLRFDPDTAAILNEILAARTELERMGAAPPNAKKIGRLLKTAQEIFLHPGKLSDYLDGVYRRIREQYTQATQQGPLWGINETIAWLEREQWVHPYALAKTARWLIADRR